METKKLYRVTLRGMTGWSNTTVYGVSYSIAENPSEAYQKVKKFLDENDLGFHGDRELDKVELIAEEAEYPACQTILYL